MNVSFIIETLFITEIYLLLTLFITDIIYYTFITEIIININWNKSIKQRSHFALTSDD